MTNFTRRNVNTTLFWGGIASLCSSASIAQATEKTADVATQSGRVRGMRVDGVASFLGIAYGAETHSRRFQPALPAPTWTGVRDCFIYGATAPQGTLNIGAGAGGKVNPEVMRVMATLFSAGPQDRPPPESEDCLVLNVFTPDASRSRKRPVMFWLHGGGFAQGSGSSAAYDGSALCRRGDVVVVTINHRLNALGYLYLGALHDDFADSGNVGQLDQILALQWVRDNIEAFGGDPHNVTIFGESGGGAKVSVLMAMPSATGLFHKAIIQSGPGLKMVERDDAAALAERTLAALNVSKTDVHKLQSLDSKTVIGAATASQGSVMGARSLSPVVDGRSLPRHPFDPDAPQGARNIPVIIGTNKDEATLFTMFEPDFGKMTVEQVQQRFATMLGDKSNAAFELFRKRRPNDSPTYWLTSMVTGMGTWINSIKLAERKAAQGGAPAFMYRLDWETPVLNGTLKAPHGLDTPLVFDNADKAAGLCGNGPEPKKIAADMSQAWINFARTGNPSLKGLAWPAYEVKSRKTLVFDVPSHVASDIDHEVRQFFAT